VRQATHKGYRVILDSNKPGLWVCEQFIPFTNDPETNLWLLPLFPPTSEDNGIYPMPSYSVRLPEDLQALRQQWLMEHHRLGHPSQKRQAALDIDGLTKPKVPKLACPTCLASLMGVLVLRIPLDNRCIEIFSMERTQTRVDKSEFYISVRQMMYM
jgi:hypothetical protein